MENRDRDKLSQSEHSSSEDKVNRNSLNDPSRRSGSGSMESGSGRTSGNSGVSGSSSNISGKKSNKGSSDIGSSGDIGRGSQGSSRQ